MKTNMDKMTINISQDIMQVLVRKYLVDNDIIPNREYDLELEPDMGRFNDETMDGMCINITFTSKENNQ